ncbi:MAG TPA: GNAT family N-acetyltransferase [Flavobacteriales bacterium]|nr:GNAT family N-acetyltransferase [Flavobacteriales bacterium]
MLEVNFDPFPVLETQRLCLRKFTTEDTPAMFVLRSDEEIMHFIPRPLAKTEQDARELIDKMNTGIANAELINWAIVLKETNALIGLVGFVKIHKEHYRGELGYMLHKNFHGKGLMLEATTAVIEHGFNTMNLHSIEAIINPANSKSARVLERHNFRKEAHFKENFFHRGVFEDTIIFGLLKSDYKKS